MARIVLISPYLKGGQNAAKLAHRTRYVATRPGVELLADESSTLHATKRATRCRCIKGWRRNRRSAQSLLPAVRAVDGGFNAGGCGVYSEDFLYDWRLTSVKSR